MRRTKTIKREEKQPVVDPEEGEPGSTDRLLFLSDGIFAIAITLLVLDLKVPEVGEHGGTAAVRVRDVVAALGAQWPRFCGYLLSFINIGVMWNNHVTMFRYIRRCDHTLTVLNALLLLCISVNPFITSLLSDYLLLSPAHRQVGALVFSGVWFVTAVAFNALWAHAFYKQRLLDSRFSPAHYADIKARYRWGPAIYFVVFLFAAAGLPTVCLVLSACLTLLYALPYNASKRNGEVMAEVSGQRPVTRLFRRR